MLHHLGLLLLFLSILCHFPLSGIAQKQDKRSFILDADTGNEVDDYYALARAFVEPSWEIICLNATQWQSSQWAIPQTMENSHRLNQVLLDEMGMSIKSRRGGVDRMFDWGDKAQHSAAAYEIIKQSKLLEENEKLSVIALGALTNIASAVYIEPEIASKIKLYWLGTTYDFEKGILKRQDFNCMMDQQALEVVLMSEVEMHVIPINVAVEMKFDYAETVERLPKGSNLSRLLLDRWFQHLDGGRKERVIWDLALIQAIIFPEWAETSIIRTSKDHGERQIHYYSLIEAKNMREEFFEAINSFQKQK
ncbi:MAG: nucleoside hydrolase [Bacteroidota bacterium]